MSNGVYRTPTPYSRMEIGPHATEGTLSRRFWGYLIDILVIAAVTLGLGFIVFILGFLTFGLAWAAYAVLPLATATLYNAITISGPSQGTIGMRMAGVRVLDASTGGQVSFLAAAVHAFLFYVGLGTALLVLDILIGFVRSDARMGRDLLTNVVVVRD